MVRRLTIVLLLAGCTASEMGSADLAAAPIDLAAPPDLAPEVDASSTFGQPCNPSFDPACSDDSFCLWAPTNKYFCSQACAKQGASCPGGPPGTAAFCIVTDATPDGQGGCGFVCAAHGKSYPCPAGLTCQTSDDPPGSGQRLCLP